MSEHSTGLWLFLRWPITLMVVGAMVYFAILSQVNVTSEEVHADIIAAKVAYSGGFSPHTGVIDAHFFRQRVADNYLQSDGERINVPIGVGVRLLDPTCIDPLRLDRDAQQAVRAGDENPTTITYNSFAYKKIQGFWTADRRPRGVHAKEYYFPAILQWDETNEQPVCMNMEVLYEK